MALIVQPLLYHLGNEIVRGLSDGTFIRWGGIIRRAAGTPGAGQIVAHLRELGTVSQVPAQLSTLLTLGQVGAAASVLNLGVSVAGFAIMVKKLDRLQGDMLRVLRTLDRNHTEVMGALAEVKESLVELKYLELQGQDLVLEAIAEVKRVRQDLLNSYLARMLVEYQVLRSEQPTDTALEAARKVFSEARRWLELGLDGEILPVGVSPRWFDVLVRFRLWCFAVLGEVATARRLHAREEALITAQDAAARARGWSKRWTDSLVPTEEFGGLRRFSFSSFRSLPEETRLRLRRLEAGDFQVSLRTTERDLDGSRAVAEALPLLPPQWQETQRALALTLDFVEEVTERLDSLREELDLCARLRLLFEEWEALPARQSSDTGLAFIQLLRPALST